MIDYSFSSMMAVNRQQVDEGNFDTSGKNYVFIPQIRKGNDTFYRYSIKTISFTVLEAYLSARSFVSSIVDTAMRDRPAWCPAPDGADGVDGPVSARYLASTDRSTKVNVEGTRIVLNAALRHGFQRFVLV